MHKAATLSRDSIDVGVRSRTGGAMRKLIAVISALFFIQCVPGRQAPSSEAATNFFTKRPKLLVTIVIDQFRADYLTRFQSRFLPARSADGSVGGFKYLTSEGAYYPLAEYNVAQSITSPGHATILTGAYPYRSAVPLNAWVDRTTNKLINSVDDSRFPAVRILVSDDAEPTIDASPMQLAATTIGDELKNAGYPSRVVSIALKARAAVLLGGFRADLALWMDSRHWISSRYYLPDGTFPEWVSELNKTTPAVGSTIEWKLDHAGTGYSAKDSMALTDAQNAGAIGGRNFPHSAKYGTPQALAMPIGLELTERAAEYAIRGMQLGRSGATDVLAVSFSSHDMIGHAFGPNSREMEEMTVAEDAAIARLLNFIQREVPGGLDETVFVLTADHGAPPSPEWAAANKLPAGRIDMKALAAELSAHLNAKFGEPKSGKWVHATSAFNIFLNDREMGERRLERGQVEDFAKEFIARDPRIQMVVTRTDRERGLLPRGEFELQLVHSYTPGKSGDILVIPKPLFVGVQATVDHATGYSYDRTVPIILTGRFIRKGVYTTRAEVVDIAPTLAALLGTIPPTMSEGRKLSEALDFSGK